jgi:glycerol-3-phosphate cytidylyltransferase-like family protein
MITDDLVSNMLICTNVFVFGCMESLHTGNVYQFKYTKSLHDPMSWVTNTRA